jgi:acyl carrier protein
MSEITEKAVFNAIDAFNSQSDDVVLEKKLDYCLFGDGGALDSFDFVSFISEVEDSIFNETGKSISIVSEKAFSKKYNPFKDFERLIQYIDELIQ